MSDQRSEPHAPDAWSEMDAHLTGPLALLVGVLAACATLAIALVCILI
jgi:hypothetical protein